MHNKNHRNTYFRHTGDTVQWKQLQTKEQTKHGIWKMRQKTALFPVSCILHPMRRSNLPQKLYCKTRKHSRKQKSVIRGCLKPLLGTRCPALQLPKQLRWCLRLPLCTTQLQPNRKVRDSRQIEGTAITTGNDTFLTTVLLSLIALCLKIPRKHFRHFACL